MKPKINAVFLFFLKKMKYVFFAEVKRVSAKLLRLTQENIMLMAADSFAGNAGMNCMVLWKLMIFWCDIEFFDFIPNFMLLVLQKYVKIRVGVIIVYELEKTEKAKIF